MRSTRWLLWVTAVTIILMTGPASAFVITGSPLDWGISNASVGLNGTDSVGSPVIDFVSGGGTIIRYWEEQGHNTNGFVQPGYGGAPFDIKGLYFTWDATNYYFAAVVGMGPGGTVNGGIRYIMGDILISGPGHQYGIVTSDTSDSTGQRPNYDYAQGTFGEVSALGNINDPGFSSSNPVFANVLTGDTGVVPFYYVNLDTNLWFIEASVSRSLFASSITGIHLTASCGNDVADLPVAPVPEPGTMMLLGGGLVGLAGWGRKKFRK